MNINQNATTAAVTSVLSGRAHVYITEAGTVGCAVDGLQIPYRIFVIHLVCAMFNTAYDDMIHEKSIPWSIYDSVASDLAIPEKYKETWGKDPNTACRTAIRTMWKTLSKEEDASEKLTAMLREIEEDYQSLVDELKTTVVN